MRISKQLARSVAEAALLDRRNSLQSKKAAMQSYIADFLEKNYIPEEVRAFNQKWPEYSNTYTGIYFIGNVVKREFVWIELGRQIPVKNTKGWGGVITVTDSDYLHLLGVMNGLDQLQSSLQSDLVKLETAIFAFNTKKQVIKHLPELEKFFPEEENTQTSVGPTIDSIRQILKQ